MACIVPHCQHSKPSGEKLSMHLFPDPMRDPKRHLSWVKTINAEKIYKFDPLVVFKRFRVCRIHFTTDCFNGDCKKLLPNAIPTLYLGYRDKLRYKSFNAYSEKVFQMLKKNSVNIEEETLKFIDLDENEQDKLWNSTEKEEVHNEEEFLLMEVENDDNQSQFTIVMPPNENLIVQKPQKVLNYNRSQIFAPKSAGSIEKSSIPPLNKTKLVQYQAAFNKNPKNLLAQNICSKLPIFEAAFVTDNGINFNHQIDLKIDENAEKIHWSFPLFTSMNVSFMKKFNLKKFEFSQTHFIYYEKIERCYYFLSTLIDKLNSEDAMSEQTLLDDPLKVGGRWNIFTSIVKKYGLVPKEVFLMDISIESLENLNEILKTKLKEYSKNLIDAKSRNASLTQLFESQISEISEIVAIFLGTPPDKFTWNYENTENKSFKIYQLTPLEFYEQYVKTFLNVDDKCCLINDPRPSLEFHNLYTSETSQSIIGECIALYNNQPIDVLIDAVSKSILNGEPVVAICPINAVKNFKLKNFNLLCDVKITTNLDKSARIELGDYSEKYATIITAISTDLENFRLEEFINNKRKHLTIPKENFEELVSEVIVNKKFLSGDTKNIYNLSPNTLTNDDPINDLFL